VRYPFILLSVYFLYIGNAAAYVGPGLGLGAIGAFIGVVASVFLAIIGLFWYPIKRLYKSMRAKLARNSTPEDS
jgi:hypothetical protein